MGYWDIDRRVLEGKEVFGGIYIFLEEWDGLEESLYGM